MKWYETRTKKILPNDLTLKLLQLHHFSFQNKRNKRIADVYTTTLLENHAQKICRTVKSTHINISYAQNY